MARASEIESKWRYVVNAFLVSSNCMDEWILFYLSSTVFCNLFFFPMAHSTFTMAREDAPQYLAFQKGGGKQYIATKNVYPI
jgi:hypothetical protein